MGRMAGLLGLLGIVIAAHAEVDVRIWVTTVAPTASNGGGMVFKSYYGPFTPYSMGVNTCGTYDIHKRYVSSTNPGDVQTGVSFAKSPAVIEPGVATGGDVFEAPLYVWATFCGQYDDPDTGEPIPGAQPGYGWAYTGAKITGLDLVLKTDGPLWLEPYWYQFVSGSASRWETASDMTGNHVTLEGTNATGWTAGASADMMQCHLDDESGDFTAGAILLGAIQWFGWGKLYIGLGDNGIATNFGTPVRFFPGAAQVGIDAGVDPNAPDGRFAATEQAYLGVPEPACLSLMGLALLALRRR